MAKYNVGDKVKYVGNGDIFEHGEILKVEADDGCSSLPLLVSKGNGAQWVDYSEVKQYKSKKSRRIKTLKQTISTLESQVDELQAVIDALKNVQATPKFAPVTTDNIAVGDKVRFSNARHIENGEELTSGKLYEVVKLERGTGFYVLDDVEDYLYIATYEFMYVEKEVYE